MFADLFFETLGTPRSAVEHESPLFRYHRWWRIEGKSKDRGNVKAISTYGTQRINAYELSKRHNLKDVRIF